EKRAGYAPRYDRPVAGLCADHHLSMEQRLFHHAVERGDAMSEPRQEPVPGTHHEPGGDAPPASDAPPQETIHVDRFEAAWMRIAAAVLAIFFISILVSAFASGF